MKRRNAFALARRLHVLQVLLAVLLTVAINVAAVALSQRYPLRLDLTANGRYELSEENREFLAALDKQIHFYVLADQEEYARASTYTTYAATLLAQYPLYADVEVTYVDFAADPTFASRYPDLELAQNGIVVECEDRAVALETSDLFEYSYSRAKRNPGQRRGRGAACLGDRQCAQPGARARDGVGRQRRAAGGGVLPKS